MKKLTQQIRLIASRVERSVQRLMPWLPSTAPGPVRTPALNKVLLNLCGGDKVLAMYVLAWLARPMRRSGTKMPNALWFKGEQGNGKSLYFERLVLPLFGQHGVIAPGLSSVFNDWMRDVRLAVVSEEDTRAFDAAKLKQLITSEYVQIQRKGHPSARIRNRMNLIFMSGHSDPMPSADDRRFLVIDSGPALPAEIYAAAEEEIRNGAIYALGHYLRTHQALDHLVHPGVRARPLPSQSQTIEGSQA